MKMKYLGQGFQKLQNEQDTNRQTDATERITTPYSRVVKLLFYLFILFI